MGDKNLLFRGFPFVPNSLKSVENQNRFWCTTAHSRRKIWGDSTDVEGF